MFRTTTEDALPTLPAGFEGVCEIEKTYVRETRYGRRFFCEMTTAEGQHVVWTLNLSSVVAPPILQQWAAAAMGVSPAEFARNLRLQGLLAQAVMSEFARNLRLQGLLAQAVTSPDANSFAQRRLLVRVSRVMSKNGRPILVHHFSPLGGALPPGQEQRTEESRPQPTRKVRLQ